MRMEKFVWYITVFFMKYINVPQCIIWYAESYVLCFDRVCEIHCKNHDHSNTQIYMPYIRTHFVRHL